MITIKKLAGLPASTRIRKYPRLMRFFEESLRNDVPIDTTYLRDLFSLIAGDPFVTSAVREKVSILNLQCIDKNDVLRSCNGLRHLLLEQLGASPADWDLLPPKPLEEGGCEQVRKIIELDLYLDDIRSPFNVGSIFRAAESFGVRKIFLSPGSADPRHPRAQRSAMGCVDIVPWCRSSFEEMQTHTTSNKIVALETGGCPLHEFHFPAGGILVIGSEELGVSPALMEQASRSGGAVSIETGGRKGSLNVSVATGIVLHAWFSQFRAVEPGVRRHETTISDGEPVLSPTD
ncbi:TrmH family RNA methyltransferase [Sediminispirochaeta smaragdinae]|uniref:tRNA/rRNA methyltransferase (SpoU) n=1 Tax=Sediminispirochaeta smaragdinae (strain DSM 11293 / JCM 15392 / SEBR 4228) TaxID=573413 RepID=E1RAU4_SEDSS|nr:TrmH family RNA methyltransferase [Sediminispirochaeta smaragdinae]ADK79474.1 tRNA/rRNA methyltransferase (SpoU) [Sediminispirochaeta smaragdinae DSM 11293]